MAAGITSNQSPRSETSVSGAEVMADSISSVLRKASAEAEQSSWSS